MPATIKEHLKPGAVHVSGPKSVALQNGLASLSRVLLPCAYFACGVVFFMGFASSWHRADGFTSLIHFGSKFEGRSLEALKKIPHAVEPDSPGYDGQFYAQLALSPALENPQLPTALDSISYRSRRILFSWTAWVLGLGQPAWVIQAYALQNVLFWLGAAILLLNWLPPTRWFHFVQWASILFSRGWLESVGSALLDGPALFLMLLAIWWSERRRPLWGTALLGVSMLGKETNLLAGLVAFEDLRLRGPGKKALIIRALLLSLPLALWLAVVHFQFGFRRAAGTRNFAAPFVGWFSKAEELKLNAVYHGWHLQDTLTVLCLIATIVQIAYFATVWQWSTKWWRIGAPYALLGICLGPAVMEGYPGAFTRALLPMLAAYNLSLKPTSRGWLLLLVGNLHVIYGTNILGLGRLLNLC